MFPDAGGMDDGGRGALRGWRNASSRLSLWRGSCEEGDEGRENAAERGEGGGWSLSLRLCVSTSMSVSVAVAVARSLPFPISAGIIR